MKRNKYADANIVVGLAAAVMLAQILVGRAPPQGQGGPRAGAAPGQAPGGAPGGGWSAAAGVAVGAAVPQQFPQVP